MNEGTRIGDMVRRKRAGGERTEYTSIAIGRIRVTWEITYVHILPSFLKKTQGTEAMAASSVSSGNWTFCRQASKCSRCVSAASLVRLVRVTWIPVFYPRPDSRNSLSTFFSLSVLCYLSLATWYETRFVAKTVFPCFTRFHDCLESRLQCVVDTVTRCVKLCAIYKRSAYITLPSILP